MDDETDEGAGQAGGQPEEASPEEVVAELRGKLQEREQEAANERQRREQAEAQARQAGGAVAGAHEVAITARVTAEEQRLASARAAYRAAREGGDVDAEIAASEEIASARQMVDGLKTEKARMAAAPQQPAGGQYSAAAQNWIARNPKFNTDRIYRSVAEGAHAQALESGIAPDSPAYFKHLDETLARTFGAPQQQSGREEGMNRGGQQQPTGGKPAAPGRPPASSFATPSGRGNPTNARGSSDVNAIAGELGVTAEDVRMFADASGMKVEDYCKQQSKILEERKRGGSGSLHGSDAVFR